MYECFTWINKEIDQLHQIYDSLFVSHQVLSLQASHMYCLFQTDYYVMKPSYIQLLIWKFIGANKKEHLDLWRGHLARNTKTKRRTKWTG